MDRNMDRVAKMNGPASFPNSAIIGRAILTEVELCRKRALQNVKKLPGAVAAAFAAASVRHCLSRGHAVPAQYRKAKKNQRQPNKTASCEGWSR